MNRMIEEYLKDNRVLHGEEVVEGIDTCDHLGHFKCCIIDEWGDDRKEVVLFSDVLYWLYLKSKPDTNN